MLKAASQSSRIFALPVCWYAIAALASTLGCVFIQSHGSVLIEDACVPAQILNDETVRARGDKIQYHHELLYKTDDIAIWLRRVVRSNNDIIVIPEGAHVAALYCIPAKGKGITIVPVDVTAAPFYPRVVLGEGDDKFVLYYSVPDEPRDRPPFDYIVHILHLEKGVVEKVFEQEFHWLDYDADNHPIRREWLISRDMSGRYFLALSSTVFTKLGEPVWSIINTRIEDVRLWDGGKFRPL